MPQTTADLQRGAARYQGACAASADGSWRVEEGDPARLAWRLEYDKSTVYFALHLAEGSDGALSGKGDFYDTARAGTVVKRVGTFDARRVSRTFPVDLR